MSKNHEVMSFPYADIVVNEEWNPRREYNAGKDEEGGSVEALAKDMGKHGQLTPVMVRLVDVDGTSVPHLIAGFRRMRAMGIAGIKTVKATVVDVDESGAAVINLIENVQRKNLTAAELAIGLSRLSDDGMSAAQIGARVGLSKSHVGNLVRIKTKAIPDVWGRFSAGKLTVLQALAIVGAGDDAEAQETKLHEVLGLKSETKDGEGDGEGSGEGSGETEEKEKKKGPSKPKADEIALMCQAAREIAAGRIPLPRGKKTDDFYRGVASALAWAIGEQAKPPFNRPKLETEE